MSHKLCKMIQNFKKKKNVPPEMTGKFLQQAMEKSENNKFIKLGFSPMKKMMFYKLGKASNCIWYQSLVSVRIRFAQFVADFFITDSPDECWTWVFAFLWLSWRGNDNNALWKMNRTRLVEIFGHCILLCFSYIHKFHFSWTGFSFGALA